jgi:hypothetical protein
MPPRSSAIAPQTLSARSSSVRSPSTRARSCATMAHFGPTSSRPSRLAGDAAEQGQGGGLPLSRPASPVRGTRGASAVPHPPAPAPHPAAPATAQLRRERLAPALIDRLRISPWLPGRRRCPLAVRGLPRPGRLPGPAQHLRQISQRFGPELGPPVCLRPPDHRAALRSAAASWLGRQQRCRDLRSSVL